MGNVREERLELLRTRLKNYYEAEEAILLNQEYVIGTKSLKRADLATVRAAIKDLQDEIEKIEGGGKNKAFRFLPRDI